MAVDFKELDMAEPAGLPPQKSFIESLKPTHQTTTPSNHPTMDLSTLCGRVDSRGVERISTEALFDQLGVPPFKRTPELASRLRGLMVAQGWTPIRGNYMTNKGHAARVRGYARLQA